MISFLIKVLQKILNLLHRLNRRQASSGTSGDEHQKGVLASTQMHDMKKDADEQYYTRQYWHWILPRLEARKAESKRILDLGCGQGRMSTKLASWAPAAEIVGVDSSSQAITSAKQYAQDEHITNVNYIVSDILAYLSAQADSTFDVAFFLEVSFFMPEFKKVITEIKRVLKKDGLVFASFRSQYFDALYSMKQNDWESAQMILDSRTGSLWGSKIQFTWQTSSEVSDLFKGHEFKLLDLAGIGVMSGIKGDPHEYIARPSTLLKENQGVLNTLEISNAKIVPDAGRYMLAIAQK